MDERQRLYVHAELRELREENARLKSLLAAHGIPWQEGLSSGSRGQAVSSPPQTDGQHVDTAARVSLFRKLFRGRADAYAVRWESANGKSGYAIACDNDWRPGVCGKPRLRCTNCEQRRLLPVTDQVIYQHLAGKHTVGVYPLLSDDTCYFLAADFDGAEWREDACAFVQSCATRLLGGTVPEVGCYRRTLSRTACLAEGRQADGSAASVAPC